MQDLNLIPEVWVENLVPLTVGMSLSVSPFLSHMMVLLHEFDSMLRTPYQ